MNLPIVGIVSDVQPFIQQKNINFQKKLEKSLTYSNDCFILQFETIV